MITTILILVLCNTHVISANAIRNQVIYTVAPGSQVEGIPKVKITPLGATTDANSNLFQYGVRTNVEMSVKLVTPIVQGATAEAWLSSLSLGEVARVAANQFIPYTDVCEKLDQMEPMQKQNLKLPDQCPVPAQTMFSFDQALGDKFWRSVEKFKSQVVGSSGVLEVRLWSKEPCTVCFTKPTLLAGFSVPFEIAGSEPAPTKPNKTKKSKKKKRKKEL
jgi:hypothetical protein